mmetsp:Transcript_26106/g.65795  ORF Transcript_26106/g.65795 Transcript_26106/m.65795 type:complete len:368 (+) Transcript_26106:307-1410(+)
MFVVSTTSCAPALVSSWSAPGAVMSSANCFMPGAGIFSPTSSMSSTTIVVPGRALANTPPDSDSCSPAATSSVTNGGGLSPENTTVSSSPTSGRGSCACAGGAAGAVAWAGPPFDAPTQAERIGLGDATGVGVGPKDVIDPFGFSSFRSDWTWTLFPFWRKSCSLVADAVLHDELFPPRCSTAFAAVVGVAKGGPTLAPANIPGGEAMSSAALDGGNSGEELLLAIAPSPPRSGSRFSALVVLAASGDADKSSGCPESSTPAFRSWLGFLLSPRPTLGEALALRGLADEGAREIDGLLLRLALRLRALLPRTCAIFVRTSNSTSFCFCCCSRSSFCRAHHFRRSPTLSNGETARPLFCSSASRCCWT